MANDKIHTLEEELNRAYRDAQAGEEGAPASAAEAGAHTLLDHELTLDEANWDTYKTIEKLAPFGTGNPKPTFIFRNLVPRDVKHFGKEKNHLELVFEQSDPSDFSSRAAKKLSAIAFFKTSSDWGREVVVGKPIDLVATFEKSMFRSFPELRLRIVDIC